MEGMTTERTLEIFNDYDRINCILLKGNDEGDTKFNSETIEAMNNIQIILRKYQKIEQIIEEDRYGKPILKTINEIIKVVENGVD